MQILLDRRDGLVGWEVKVGEDGKPSNMMGVVTDITRVKDSVMIQYRPRNFPEVGALMMSERTFRLVIKRGRRATQRRLRYDVIPDPRMKAKWEPRAYVIFAPPRPRAESARVEESATA
jgi:hypothetical protein